MCTPKQLSAFSRKCWFTLAHQAFANRCLNAICESNPSPQNVLFMPVSLSQIGASKKYARSIRHSSLHFHVDVGLCFPVTLSQICAWKKSIKLLVRACVSQARTKSCLILFYVVCSIGFEFSFIVISSALSPSSSQVTVCPFSNRCYFRCLACCCLRHPRSSCAPSPRQRSFEGLVKVYHRVAAVTCYLFISHPSRLKTFR